MEQNEQANHPPSPGALPVIDGYSDLRLIGSGGYSQVYTAWQERFARTVAIKIITVELSDTALRRFGREQATTGQLDGHPHVIRVYDSGFTEHRQPYLTMEYHEQGSLADRVRQHGPMPVDEVVAIGVKLACALDAAHRQGTIHRDVKPQNVLVSPFVGPVLADFGIAAVDDARIRTITSEAFSALHVAPEVLEGHQAAPTSDLYSLASTLYELLAGRAPFAAQDDPGLLSLMRRIRTEPLPPIERADIPAQLTLALSAMLAREPDERPASGLAMAEALRAVQADLGLELTPLVPDPSRASADQPDRPAPSWALGSGDADAGDLPPSEPAEVADPPSQLGAAAPLPDESLDITGPRGARPTQSPTVMPAASSAPEAAPAEAPDESALETTDTRGKRRGRSEPPSKRSERPPEAPPNTGDDPLSYTIERRAAQRADEPKPLITEADKKSRLPLIIGLSTTGVLLVGIVAWFFLIRDTGSSDDEAASPTTTEPDPADILPPCPQALTGDIPMQQGFDVGVPPASLDLEQSPDGASAHLTWDDPNDGSNYYVLYVACDSAEYDNLPRVAMTAPGDPAEATIEGLSLDHNYCFSIGVLQPAPIDDEGNLIELSSSGPTCMDSR